MENSKKYMKRYYQEHREKLREKRKEKYYEKERMPIDSFYDNNGFIPYTKYELQHIEELYPMEKGRINWDVWNRVIEQGKQEIKEWELEQQELKRHTNNHKPILRFVYNLYGQLVAQGDAKALEGILKPYGTFSRETITTYANHKWIKDGFYFTNTNYRYKDIENIIMAINLAKKRKKQHNDRKRT